MQRETMSPIERAARAMCLADGFEPDKDDQVLAPPGLPNWGLYQEKARAALQAIRDPSEGMQRAIDPHRMAGNVDDATSKRYWQAMIDAALQEG